MLGGILHETGYFMGDDLYLPRGGNPKGFFECPEINKINEDILFRSPRKILPGFLRRMKKCTVDKPSLGQGWLISIPFDITINYLTDNIEKRIQKMVSRSPFAYKDPRFCYTLPVWEKFLDRETVVVCMFREPSITIKSILKEIRTVKYLKNLTAGNEDIYNVWINMYSHVLNKHVKHSKNMIFVHYDQIYDGSGLNRISKILNVQLSMDFVDKNLKRTIGTSVFRVPLKALHIYEEMCHLAGHPV
jgi:hypothetical protein